MREIQSLARGLQIIDWLMNANKALGITELAEKLDVDKSTASRLVSTLQNYGYVQQDRDSRAYVIGKRLHNIGWQITNRFALREVANSYLHRLVKETGECAHIGVYSAGKALVLDDIQPENALLRVVGVSGRLIHLHNTAIGKALLAFNDFPLPKDFPLLTPNTITTPEDLTEDLTHIRLNGYAVDNEENEFGVRCIASPVFDAVGVTVAAIGISGPTVRVKEERVEAIGELVKNTALQLSHDLGFEDAIPYNITIEQHTP